MNISVIGTGYVGLTLSALLAKVGHKVHCIDVIEDKIKTIKEGKSYFYELGLDNLVKYGIDSRNLTPTLNYEEGVKDADIIFLSVGTPSGADGGWDLTYIYDAVENAAKFMKDGVIFVQRSTVPVGTGKRAIEIIKKTNPKANFTYLSSPEFLREGSAVLDSIIQDRIVMGGDNEEKKKILFKIFEEIEKMAPQITEETPEIHEYASTYISNGGSKEGAFKDKCISTCLESAELIKVCSNTFLATKITFANNIARVCDRVGANINEVMDGVGMDRRIGRSFLYAGLGFGGGCFPKDVKGLIKSTEDLGVDAQLFKRVYELNESQVDYVVDCIKQMGVLGGSQVGVLGLSFKPGTSDVRVSPAGRLCKALSHEGFAVLATDPRAIEESKKDFPEDKNLKYVDTVEDVFKNSEIVVLATEWPEYKELDYERLSKLMKSKNFYDARNFLEKEKMNKIFKFDNLGA
ncbi:MAG: UDP-glucose/GDP-mannose dehydrogenase family protein [Candidatus Dojkabacteria bacterium]|nr:UDP-glucose/GDP-mannose dehydrogenase family protein [Candidatus Dojkabacteria bacterium]